MQMVNCLVALGGDRRNTVPKKCITVAEIAVLQRIHGGDAVFDVEPATLRDLQDSGPRLHMEYSELGGYQPDKKTGVITVSNRAELARLRDKYRSAKNEDGAPIVEEVYPGAGAAVFTDLQALGLPEDAFKPIARAKPDAPAKRGKAAVEPEDALEVME